MSKYLINQPGVDGFASLSSLGADVPRRFRKEVMYEGKFIHPSTGKTHQFSRADLERIAEQSNALEAKQRIPFPDGHDFSAQKNMGFWKDFTVAPRVNGEGHGLFATVHVPLEAHAQLVGKTIDSVSVYLERNVKLSDGTVFEGPVCTHVCGTNYPVIRQQHDFEQFAKSQGGDVELLEFGDDSVDKIKTLLIAALGLKAEASEKEIGDALRTAFAAKTQLAAENEKLLSDLKEAIGMASSTSAALDAGKSAAAEPVKSKREQELEAQLSALRGQAVTTMLDAALSVGKITKVERDAYLSICSLGTLNVVPFGKTAAEEVNTVKIIEAILSSRQSNSAVPMGTQSNRGESETAAAAKARVKSQADWFSARGYEVKIAPDGLSYEVNRSAQNGGRR